MNGTSYNSKIAAKDTGLEGADYLPDLLTVIEGFFTKAIEHKVHKKNRYKGTPKNKKTKELFGEISMPTDRLPNTNINELSWVLIEHIKIAGEGKNDHGLGKLHYIRDTMRNIAEITRYEDVDHGLFLKIGNAIGSRKFELKTMGITEVTKDSLNELKIPLNKKVTVAH